MKSSYAYARDAEQFMHALSGTTRSQFSKEAARAAIDALKSSGTTTALLGGGAGAAAGALAGGEEGRMSGALTGAMLGSSAGLMMRGAANASAKALTRSLPKGAKPGNLLNAEGEVVMVSGANGRSRPATQADYEAAVLRGDSGAAARFHGTTEATQYVKNQKAFAQKIMQGTEESVPEFLEAEVQAGRITPDRADKILRARFPNLEPAAPTATQTRVERAVSNVTEAPVSGRVTNSRGSERGVSQLSQPPRAPAAPASPAPAAPATPAAAPAPATPAAVPAPSAPSASPAPAATNNPRAVGRVTTAPPSTAPRGGAQATAATQPAPTMSRGPSSTPPAGDAFADNDLVGSLFSTEGVPVPPNLNSRVLNAVNNVTGRTAPPTPQPTALPSRAPATQPTASPDEAYGYEAPMVFSNNPQPSTPPATRAMGVANSGAAPPPSRTPAAASQTPRAYVPMNLGSLDIMPRAPINPSLNRPLPNSGSHIARVFDAAGNHVSPMPFYLRQ